MFGAVLIDPEDYLKEEIEDVCRVGTLLSVKDAAESLERRFQKPKLLRASSFPRGDADNSNLC